MRTGTALDNRQSDTAILEQGGTAPAADVPAIDRDRLAAIVAEAGDSLIEMIRRTANGRMTAAEALNHREFVMTKLYRSA